MTTSRKKSTVEVTANTSEAKVSEGVAETLDVVTLQAYIEKASPTPGLVASFKYEAEQSEIGLADRTEAEWEAAFKAQATRIYPSFQ